MEDIQTKIELQDVLNISDGRFEYIGEDTLVSRIGCSLFFFSLSSHKQHSLHFPPGYSLDAWTLSNQTTVGHGEQQIVVALSGPETRIHVYSWPRLHLEQSFIVNDEVCYHLLALSRDGRYLVGVSAESHVKVKYWDLQAPDIEIRINDDESNQTNRLLRDREVSLTLQEEMTYCSFNPFNHTQVVVGNERSVWIVNITAATSFQLATLTPQQILLDANNLNNRRITCITWFNDKQILLATKSGEILSCQIQPPASVVTIREREIAAAGVQQQSGGGDSPVLDRSGNATPSGLQPGQGGYHGGNAGENSGVPELGLKHLTDADLSILGLINPTAPEYLHTDWKGAVDSDRSNQLTVTLWASNLPLAPPPANEDENEEDKGEDEEEKVEPKQSPSFNASGTGAIINCMTLTRHELVVGTHDGCLLWLNRHAPNLGQVAHQQHIDVSSGLDQGILQVTFSPSFATFITLTRRGHLRLFKPLSDRAAPTVRPSSAPQAEGEAPPQPSSAFQTSSLGHFPIAGALTAPTQTLSASTAALLPSVTPSTLPHSLLRTRPPIRVSHVLLPTPPSDLHPKNFRLLSFTSYGLIQIWCYGLRQLLGTYHFKSGISTCSISPDGHVAVLGCENGVVNVLDITNPSYLRLIFSQRLHAGPVVQVEFNREGDVFTSMGLKKLFWLRASDFRVLGYGKLVDWLSPPEKSQQKSGSTSPSARSPALNPSESSDPTPPALSLITPKLTSEETAAAASALALKSEKAKYDDEDEFEVETEPVAPGKTITPEHDTFIANCWSAPADREKLPNDRVLLSTRSGKVVCVTSPNIYHDGTELKLEYEFVQPVITNLANTAAKSSAPLLALQSHLSDRTTIYATDSLKNLSVWNLQYDSTLKFLKYIGDDLPEDQDASDSSAPTDSHVHQRPCTTFAQSLLGNIFVTSGRDGLITIRDGTDHLGFITRFSSHDFIVGGTTAVSVSPDSTRLISSGYDGTLLVWDLASIQPTIQSLRSRKLKNLPAPIYSPKVLAVFQELTEDLEATTESQSFLYLLLSHSSKIGGVGGGPTSLRERDLHQKIVRDELLKSLHTFKLQYQEISNRNNSASDLEKLDFNDFALDLELKEALKIEGERRVEAVRQQIKSECVGKEYIISKIRQQCWEAMEVKGMMFTAFKGEIEVHNYPIRVLSPLESKRLRQIQFLRKMELVEFKWRQAQVMKLDEQTSEQLERREFRPAKYTEQANGYLMNMELEGSGGNNTDVSALFGGASKEKEVEKKPGLKDMQSSIRMAKKPTGETATPKNAGATGAQANAAAASAVDAQLLENLPRFLLYHPLDVITPFKKRTQAYLLNMKIEFLKKQFNDIFAEFYQIKQREIDHIHEKAKRIQEIQNELQMDQPVYKPHLTPEEIPSSVLTVLDSEIKSPKVLSSAERAIADAKSDRERKANERKEDGPNPEQGLEVMMGGTLETKRDLSLLEQELIPEEWMKTLTPEQMSEEQKLELAKFEKKVKMIQAEQDTRRKLLQTELSKLKSDVSDIAKNFDMKFKQHLSDHRIVVQREIYQHELMIIKMLNDILISEEKVKEEQVVERKIAALREALSTARILRQEFERIYRSSQQQYESMQADLKNQDRAFRRDLQNGGLSQEQQQQIAQEVAEAQEQQRQQALEEQQAILAAGGQVELDPEGNIVLPPLPPIQPSLVSSGENLDSLYKLFRTKKVTKSSKGGKSKSGAPKMQIDAITGRAVRAGSRLGLLNSALSIGTTTAAANILADIGAPENRRPGSSGSGVNANAASAGRTAGKRKSGKDGEEEGDGSMNPYPNDLFTNLSTLYQTHPSELTPGPNPQLLDDIKYLDLDERDKPESVSLELWYMLLERRAEWIEKEGDVRRYHYKLLEMSHWVKHLEQMEEAVENELRLVMNYQQNLVEARLIFSLNTEIMLRIQQGQVEIEESPVVTDLKDCEMIDRIQVERLNTVIKKQGSEKVDILKDTTISRTAINLLEWTRKKLELEHADSVDLTTELQLLRVTKSLQSLIKMGGHDNQKAAELKSLDRKIEFVSAANRDSLLGKKLKLMKVKKRIKQQNRENERLYETVQELEAAVKERMQISSIRDEGRLEESRAGKERMKSLVTRRKLVDLAKLQSEEIKFLRDQVENLRRRTFASFAIPQLTPNPDERAKSSYAALRPSQSRGPQQPMGLLPPASAGGQGFGSTMGSTGSVSQYVDSSRPHTTLPGIGREGSSSRMGGGTILPPVQRTGSASNSSRDRAVTR